MSTIARSTSASHEVQRGETLHAIAAELGVSSEALMRANGMDPSLADGRIERGDARDPDRLQVGQRLVIPVATPGLERSHRVVAGETLEGIAGRWGVSLGELLAANPQFDAGKLGNGRGHGTGRDPDLLRVGETIQRPQRQATSPAVQTEATGRAGVITEARLAGLQAAAPLAGQPQPGLDLRRFTDPAWGSNALAAIVIGSAEGTRRPDGGFTRAFGGHTDPGNAVHNRGSFSYQHAASSPADADRRQLQTLQGRLPAYEAAARGAGLNANDPRLASAYLDLYNQSPTAAQRFLNQIGALAGQPITAARITDLRVNSFVDASTGERFRLANGGQAGSGFVNIARNQLGRTPTEAEVQAVIRADQQRRTNAVESALSAQGLLAAAPTAAAPAAGGAPRWLQIARGELGTNEVRGARDNARVVEYHQTTTLRANDDETSWCSSFVNWTMEQAGVRGTDSAAARSWLNWGQAVPIDAASVRPGDVIVFPRGNNPAQGHVAIVDEVLANGRVRVVGGNQSNGEGQPDGVTESVRSLSSAIGVRRAP
jgi:uncharacterized protein (TIGR02594 family)